MNDQKWSDLDLDFADLLCDEENKPADRAAYIKQEVMNFRPVWAMYDAQGRRIGYAASREMAMALLHQNELVAHSVQ